jgi:hypothetical protein
LLDDESAEFEAVCVPAVLSASCVPYAVESAD